MFEDLKLGIAAETSMGSLVSQISTRRAKIRYETLLD